MYVFFLNHIDKVKTLELVNKHISEFVGNTYFLECAYIRIDGFCSRCELVFIQPLVFSCKLHREQSKSKPIANKSGEHGFTSLAGQLLTLDETPLCTTDIPPRKQLYNQVKQSITKFMAEVE